MSHLLIYNIGQIATPVGKMAQRGADLAKLSLVNDAAIWIADDEIKMVGSEAEVRQALPVDLAYAEIDAAGGCAIPGFVDPHTHALFAGARAEEFDERLSGVPYLELLARGGGICSTMQATRAASTAELYQRGKAVINDMLHYGVTTVEVKSGYGLDEATEMKLLKVSKALADDEASSIVSTYLGAHAVPPEYRGVSEDYVDFIIEKMLPQISQQQLADFVDVFCEEGVFSLAQTKRILQAAKAYGLAIKMHADEMNPLGGAGLACELGAISADHLLSISDDDIEKLAHSDTIAVLLPATAFCMRADYAPARKLVQAGAAIALASDYNPGSCYTYSVPLILALAVIQMRLTTAEALTAMTLNAAAALNLADCIGSIEVGKKADIVLLTAPDYRYLTYNTAGNLVATVIKNGKIVVENKKSQ